MNRLIKSLENLFAAAALNGGALSRTANFTLENVNWRDTLNMPEPTGHHIVDSYLKTACDNSGPVLTVWLWTSHLDSEVMIIRG